MSDEINLDKNGKAWFDTKDINEDDCVCDNVKTEEVNN